MPLEMAFHDLSARLQRLLDTFLGVRLTVVEDKPLRDEVALVDRFGDAVEDLVGWTREALAQGREAEQAVGHPLDTYRASKTLTNCQERFNRLAGQFSELISYERMADLHRFGRRRGGEWLRWTGTVRQALDDCRLPLQETNQALFMCWQELSERAGTTSVSIHNTTVGQQIAARDLADPGMVRDAVT